MSGHYDIIIIGTGAGGGTLARRLAPSGKKILVLERGPFLPQEEANWDPQEVLQEERYRSREVWYDRYSKPMRPAVHYYVGGNTKVYAAALVRFREKDFEEVLHKDGISPAWPLRYGDLAPYYSQAERFYDVHGRRGLDPTEPVISEPYPFPPVSHEPRIQEIHERLEKMQLNPSFLPLGIKLNEQTPAKSPCIRCNTCDGFPCRINAKADADMNGIRPALTNQNLSLLTETKALRLLTSASGREVTGVEVEINGRREIFSADIVAVACGAINSAVLLLRSANDRHPSGLANQSNLVGRYYMAHNTAVIVALSARRNPTVFQKTLAVNNFYWGDKEFPYPMGAVQLLGTLTKHRMAAHGPPLIPYKVLDSVAKHSVAWWLTGGPICRSASDCRRSCRSARRFDNCVSVTGASLQTRRAWFHETIKFRRKV